jgi:hypothetical protein
MSIIIVFSLIASGLLVFTSSSVEGDSWYMEYVDASSYLGESTSIALDSNDFPHISYYDRTTTALKYAEWTGSWWDLKTLDSDSSVGKFTSIALDSEDDPHISYYDYAYRDLKYAGRHGDKWSIKTLDGEGDVGKYTSIAVSEEDHIHISYYKVSTGDLKHVYWDGQKWNSETVDSGDDVGRFTSIALDNGGNPCISYVDYTNSNLKYAQWTGSDWNIQVISSVNLQDETSTDFGSGTSLAVDSNDQPHIVFVGGERDHLRYARWDGNVWTVEDVSNIREVYLYVSIALDSKDRPHITYFTEYDDKLHYARWTGSEWEVVYVVVNNYGWPSGKFNSVAIDSEDYAHMSFFDSRFKQLMYARFYDSRGSLQKVEFLEDEPDDPNIIIITWPNPPPDPVITPIDYPIITIENPTITIADDPYNDNLTYNIVRINNRTDFEDPLIFRYPYDVSPYDDYEWNVVRETPTPDPNYPFYSDDNIETESGSSLDDVQEAGPGHSSYVIAFASFMILILSILLVSLMSIYKGSLPKSRK